MVKYAELENKVNKIITESTDDIKLIRFIVLYDLLLFNASIMYYFIQTPLAKGLALVAWALIFLCGFCLRWIFVVNNYLK